MKIDLDKVPPAHAPYRADIDGMRAVAVAGVLLYHASKRVVPGGWLGVDIFFVISGFVVTGSLLGGTPPPPSLGAYLCAFYARRL